MTHNDDTNAEDFLPDMNPNQEEEDSLYDLLFTELEKILDKESPSNAFTTWLIGERLRRTLAVIKDPQQGIKAFKALQQKLASRFSIELTEEKLHECLKFADAFPEMNIFSELCEKLTIEHFRLIIELESDMARIFYCELSKAENWDIQKLKLQIENKAFEKEFE